MKSFSSSKNDSSNLQNFEPIRATLVAAIATFAIGIVVFILALATTFPSAAEPGGPGPNQPLCGTETTPACAPVGIDPNIQCALIAWKTFTPCNWWGIKVAEGTPGSF